MGAYNCSDSECRHTAPRSIMSKHKSIHFLDEDGGGSIYLTAQINKTFAKGADWFYLHLQQWVLCISPPWGSYYSWHWQWQECQRSMRMETTFKRWSAAAGDLAVCNRLAGRIPNFSRVRNSTFLKKYFLPNRRFLCSPWCSGKRPLKKAFSKGSWDRRWLPLKVLTLNCSRLNCFMVPDGKFKVLTLNDPTSYFSLLEG